MPRLSRRWTDPALIGIFFLCVYLVTGSADLLHNGDTDLRIQTAQAFVDHQRLWIAQPMWYDARTGVGRGGHLYAQYGPGQAILTAPLYILGLVAARLINLQLDVGTVNVVALYAARSVDLILGALLAAVFYLMAASIGFRRNTAVVLTLIFGLATAAWPDAQSALEQTQVDLCLLLAVLFVWIFVKGGMTARRWLVLSGCALGFGLVTRYDFAVYLPAVLLFPALLRVAYPQRHTLRAVLGDAAAYLAGIVPALALIAVWDWARFGSPLNTGLHQWTFGEPPLLGAASLLISPGKGLIWYVPLLFLLPFAVPAFVRRRPQLSVLFAALFLCPLLFYATVLYWHGDPAWGPRYMYVALPYLVLPMGEFLERWRTTARPLKLAAVALALLSLAIQVAAVSVTQWRYWYHLEVLDERTVNAATWTGRPFHWGPTRYHYYWNVSQSPLLYQFLDLYQVIRLDTGDDHYLLTGQPDPYVSSPVPNYPMNTLAFWWADTRHPVLGPRTRGGLAVLLAIAGALSALALLGSMRRPPRADSLAESPAPRSEPSGPLPANLPNLASGKD